MLYQNSGNVTNLGEETSFDGVLEFKDNLIISGSFSGSIKSAGSLEIGKTAECKVESMIADSVVVYGSVEGNIDGQKRVEMYPGSRIIGDVKTNQLRIADNVDFQGEVTMLNNIPDIDIFSLSPSEYKHQMIQAQKNQLQDEA